MVINGFSYATAKAGIRGKDRLDVGLIYSDTPAVAAGVFTKNRVKAAPVLIDVERLVSGKAQAILVNSGVANACTGKQGYDSALKISESASRSLGIDEEMVLVSSTGVIGEQLQVSQFEKIMSSLVASLSPEKCGEVAEAIMTTDTVPKLASRSVSIDGNEVKVLAMAKGAGMIMPNMATMLCFVMTDVNISPEILQNSLTKSTGKSFNKITVDGDTSTNDMVLILANGNAGNPCLNDEESESLNIFQQVLDDILQELALKIVTDGEGATKCVTIRVVGAKSDHEAEQAARTVANSSLVKTAFFGEDANWGRIIAALGRSGAAFNPDAVDISFDDILMVQNGMGKGTEAESQATQVLQKNEFTVMLDLKSGDGTAEIYTSDLSLDYVKINADYRS